MGKFPGFPIMNDAKKDKGSSAPEFTTDEGQVLFLVTLQC